MKEFANNLKKLRKERNMSQVQLANISGISVKTIQNYEQDRNGMAPTLPNLMMLADIFSVTPSYLYYGGDKEMYVDDLLFELAQLSTESIKEIHDSEASGGSLPKLSISNAIINKITYKWNKDVVLPKRGFYKSYVEQTIIRYAQNRKFWKEKFELI